MFIANTGKVKHKVLLHGVHCQKFYFWSWYTVKSSTPGPGTMSKVLLLVLVHGLRHTPQNVTSTASPANWPTFRVVHLAAGPWHWLSGMLAHCLVEETGEP